MTLHRQARLTSISLFCSLFCFVSACSSGNSDTTQPITDAGISSDAGSTADAGSAVDAGSPADAGASDGGAVACTASADYGTVTPLNQYGEYDPPDGGAAAFYVYQGDLNADPAPDFVDMEIYPGYGAFANGVDAGTYSLSGDDLNYGTCGLCLLVFTDTDASGNPVDSYMATGGTVTITSFEPTIAGSFANLTFQHVTIDDNNNYVSTPVGDGCNSAIDSLTYSAPDLSDAGD